MIRRTGFGVGAALLLAVLLLFLVLPVVAVFTHTTPARLISRLGDPVGRDALWLSLRTSALAMIVTVSLGTPAAFLLATRRFRGRALAITLIELPLVLPPAVAGIGLLASLGPHGLLGGLHLPLVFQTAGVVVAQTFVAAPLYLRQAQSSFDALPAELLDAARTLGAGPAGTFTRVAVPVAAPGLAAGLALAWARALGEFGATLMFAGSLQGLTQTAPLAIYDQFGSDLPAALALSAVLVIISGAILLAVKLIPGRRPLLCAELSTTVGELSLEVALQVAPGRCLALTGPSGSGKTTVLRLLAGTAMPARGHIINAGVTWLDSALGVRCAPEERRCGYVFQDLALFPHLSAWRNVAFGLRGGTRPERRLRARATLGRLGLAGRLDARPAALSGGERQRVALARALVTDPPLLLLDEPLSALDAGARAAAGKELGAVLADLRVPAVLVTHDFESAAALADEIAVLDAGRIVQRGSASELASAPASLFVAELTGAVVLTGTASPPASPDGLTTVELDGGGRAASAAVGRGRVALTLHPWEVTVSLPSAPHASSERNHLPATVRGVTRIGNRVRLALEAGQPLTAELTADAVGELGLAPGLEVVAGWKATATRLIPLADGIDSRPQVDPGAGEDS